MDDAVNGMCDPLFEPLRAVFGANITAGVEMGASIHVDIDGDSVVDLWGGLRDSETSAPWTEDTIVNVWSTTKAVTSLAILMLVDRGDIDVHTPVAHYWPEFAQNGKQHIEVRHLLSHTSGVSGWEQPFQQTDGYDIAASTARLALQSPWWPPGTASGYHSSTFGHLNAELVRRVTGKSLGKFVADEIAGPLGSDFHIGLDDSNFDRVATLYPAAGVPLPQRPTPGGLRTVQEKSRAGSMGDRFIANTPEWRRAELGGGNGHGNARSIARIMSAVTLDGVSNGVRLLSSATIALIFEEQANGVDLVLNLPLRWGIGYAMPSSGVPFIRDGRTCFWGGWGGSMIIMDLERRLTFSYAMNQMQPGSIGNDVVAGYCETVYRCLDSAPTRYVS